MESNKRKGWAEKFKKYSEEGEDPNYLDSEIESYL